MEKIILWFVLSSLAFGLFFVVLALVFLIIEDIIDIINRVKNKKKESTCNHDIQVSYFLPYNDTSYNTSTESVLFRANCIKCHKVARFPNDRESRIQSGLRYVYGCSDKIDTFRSKLYVEEKRSLF